MGIQWGSASRKPVIELRGRSCIIFSLRIPMKLVRLIKVCLSETYSRVWLGKFPDKSDLKQGNALLPLLCNFASEYVIWRVQANYEGLKFSGMHQLLLYADVIKVLGSCIHTIRKNAEAVVVTIKEIGIEVNAEKNKYMVIMSQDQHARQNHSVKTESKFFERVEYFTVFGKNSNLSKSTQEGIKSRLKSGNACYHSVQNLLSSSLLSKSIKKIKIYRTVIFDSCFVWVWNLVACIDGGK